MPNRATVEARKLCLGLVTSRAYRKEFKQRLLAGTLPANVEAMVWAYAFGKPTEHVRLSGALTLEQLLAGTYAPLMKGEED